MAKKRKKKQRLNPVLIVAAVVLLVLLVLLVRGILKDRAAVSATEEGIKYLESLETKDPAAVDAVRKELFQKRLDEEREDLLQKLHSGAMDPFSMFQDYVVLGDSRAVGFSYYGFLEESRVLAASGNTIRNISKNMESVIALNPSYVFLCYGMNDVISGLWETTDDYTAEYIQIIEELKNNLPDATIVVSSILPAQAPAFEKSSKWYDIPEWNDAIKTACEENGVGFADNTQISEEYAQMWDVDGIHVRATFYPHWATELITEALMGGVTDEG